jgi:hypothetical protein
VIAFELSPQQKELQAKVREFAIREILPAVWHYDETNDIPLFLLQKAFHAGFMNGDIPERYGGRGLGLMDTAILTEEISAACPGVATSIFDNSLGMAPLMISENGPLKEKYLPILAHRFKRICFATSEPVMGSDVAGMRCKAEKSGDDYKPVMPSLEDLPLIRGLDLNEPSEKGTPAWRCRMCGHIHYGDEPPEECPSCFFPKTAFKKVWPAA